MFTGLIERLGRVDSVEPRPGGVRLSVSSPGWDGGIAVGDSVAVNGCCLTAVATTPSGFAADVVPETLRRTTLGRLGPGDPVNLERSLRLDQRLGGHLVQGHVDGVGRVLDVRPEGEGRRVRFEAPAELDKFIAEKGSIAVDGTSLTVAAAAGREFEVAFIPHTLAVTVAGDYRPGTLVQLEVDVVARYVVRCLEAASGAGST